MFCRMAGFCGCAQLTALKVNKFSFGAQMELHELRQGVLKELEATAAAERAPEVCTWDL